jgi:uncharacterized protein (UPF0303 family)
MNAEIQADLDRIDAQYELLVFKEFDERTARALGNLVMEHAGHEPVIVDIRRGDDLLYFGANPGTSPANADWARRKRNLVNKLHIASYAVGLQEKLGTNIIDLMALDRRDHTAHGGCFPIRVAGAGIVATITVSGLPQRDDHKLATDCIAELLGVDLGAAAF